MSEKDYKGLSKEEIRNLIEMAKAVAEGDFYKEFNLRVEGELAELAKYIDKTRKSLQELHPSLSETKEKIPNASEQLKKITKETEQATLNIMNHTEILLDNRDIIEEKINEIMQNLEQDKIDKEKIINACKEIKNINEAERNRLINILEQLSFQDLTGQKINKIVSLVQEVEKRILRILVFFDLVKKETISEKEKEEEKEEKKIEQSTADKIFEKLQSENGQVDQSFIDELLNNL